LVEAAYKQEPVIGQQFTAKHLQ